MKIFIKKCYKIFHKILVISKFSRLPEKEKGHYYRLK